MIAYILQASHLERRRDNRRENRHTGQPEGRGRGIHPTTPQVAAADRGRFFGPSLSPAPYTNPVNGSDGFFNGSPQGAPLNTSPPRHPPKNHRHFYTQSSPPMSGDPTFNLGGSYNMEAAPAFPLDVTQASQEGLRGPMAAVGSTRPPALSPHQARSIDVFPIQRRRMHSLPCPVSGCPTSLSRVQDQRRHLLTHLPHWIHCPVPDCIWRGDRYNAFLKHWGNDHPSRIPVPDEDQYKTYDPQQLMKAISEGVCIQDAQKYAISIVKKRALEFRKPELSENPWGSRWKKQRNSDLRHLVPMN
jgi:hypothetical protein